MAAHTIVEKEQLSYFASKIKETYATKAEAKPDLTAYALKTELPTKATTETEGIVKPDGTTITVDDGTISATPPDLSAYAKIAQLPGVATEDTAGLVKPDGTTITVGVDGTITATADTSALATKAELADYAKSSQVATDIQSAKTELEGKIDAKVSSVYTPKGSTTSGELAEPSAENKGFVYNITDLLSTDENFVEGPGKSYPAGTNVVCIEEEGGGTYKWDVLAGITDLSGYVKADELTAITNEEIDAMFTV